MDIMTILGLVIAFGSILLGYVLAHGSVLALMKITPAIIVIGGTLGATAISFPSKTLMKLPTVIGLAFKKKEFNLLKHIEYFREISIKTRKDGLLSLESELSSANLEPFTKKGLQMVVDGIDPSAVRNILNTKLEQLALRHEGCIEMLSAAGGFAPTMGIVGTVTSLVIVLANLSDASAMGGEIASAFVATLYGLGTANLFWLPVASKLKEINKYEIIEKEMIIEAILLVQEGINPNTLVSKLEGYLTEDQAKLLNEV
jgi:chemotaxis protein MotA